MIQSRRVVGVFDAIAEAQQAVQILLNQGFSRETVELLNSTGLNIMSEDGVPVSTLAYAGSGHFLSALFGSLTEVSSQQGALVIVQTQAGDQVGQATDLLETAGANAVTVADTID